MTNTPGQPQQVEAWLRGPVAGVPPLLQPAAHALLHASDDVEAARNLPDEDLHARPGGAASVAYHLLHLAGSLDRLLTYARGEALSEAQFAAYAAERDPQGCGLGASELVDLVQATVGRAIEQLRRTPESSLLEERLIGRRRLPTTHQGVLFHAAEHSARHAGQTITTAHVVGASRRGG